MYVYITVNFLTKCYSLYRGLTYPAHINYKPQEGQIFRGPPLFETWNIYNFGLSPLVLVLTVNMIQTILPGKESQLRNYLTQICL